MSRLLSFGLTSLAALLVISPSQAQMNAAPGAQCRPAVPNASMYRNCQLRIVNGSEVCRCRIVAGATRNPRSFGSQSDQEGVTAGIRGQVRSGIATRTLDGATGGRSASSLGLAPGTAGAVGGSPAMAGPGAGASGSGGVVGSAPADEQDNAGIGNGWEGSDVSDFGGADAVASSGIDTSRGDPDNPAHGSGGSPGNSGNAGNSANAPGRNR